MKRLSFLIVVMLIALTASAQYKKVNFAVNRSSGLISFLRIKGDPYRMNWVQEYRDTLDPMSRSYLWGQAVNMLKQDPQNPVKISNTARRWSTSDDVVEVFTFKNESKVPYDMSNMRISVPFNSNPDVGSSKHHRCDITVSLNDGNKAYVKAVRQSEKAPHMALIVEKGNIGRYEMLEVEKPNSVNNGRYVLTFYPESYILKPGKSYTLQWNIFVYNDEEEFNKELKNHGWKAKK